MALQGSPEWFHENASTQKNLELLDFIEDMRERFLRRFSPEMLSEMDGDKLLDEMFGDYDNSLIRLLMYDGNYRWFGAPGEYKYLFIVYQKQDGSWAYKEGAKAQTISKAEAKEKAIQVRDQLLFCVRKIEEIGNFSSLQHYQQFENETSHVFFSSYAWVLKYYQMVFPQFFPGMYADNTILRAISILGLKSHGKLNRILNAGEISLFIRKCDVNNIIFNEVYASEWGWEQNQRPCLSASDNFNQRLISLEDPNLSYYRFSKEDLSGEALIIDKEVDELHLEGQEREAITKIRVNQSTFREKVIRKYRKCCLCGVDDPKLLVASHIKPWIDSEPKEKLDPDNGLLLCPNHDKLFDQGWISFDEDGQIMISSELSQKNQLFMNVREDMKIELKGNTDAYLRYHRKNVFQS